MQWMTRREISIFAFKTASILLGTLAHSCWRNSAGRLFQTSWTQIFCGSRLPQILLSLHVIPDRLDDVEIRALWGPYHHFQDFLFSIRLKIVLSDIVVLMHNTFGANHMPPWWFCMMDKYLPIFLSIEDTINPDQISNSICRNAVPNL